MRRKQLSPVGRYIYEVKGAMTLAELASTAGISRTQLDNILVGATGTTVETLKCLVQALKLPPGQAEELYRRAGRVPDFILTVEVDGDNTTTTYATKADIDALKDQLNAVLELLQRQAK